jgi:hypothetical protein
MRELNSNEISVVSGGFVGLIVKGVKWAAKQHRKANKKSKLSTSERVGAGGVGATGALSGSSEGG